MAYEDKVAAVTRLFEDPLLAHLNALAGGRYWDGQQLDGEALMRAFCRWSNGEYTLATLACALWGCPPYPSATRINLALECQRLDRVHVTSMLEALALRAGLPLKDARFEFTLHDELDVPA